MASCPFCEKIVRRDFWFESELAVAFPDAFPLTPGHTLIVPRRHETDFFKLTEQEEQAIWRIMRVARKELEARFAPHGYNLGVNVGAPAGQTVDHVHIHLIPRYIGDVDEPRGGIRWIIPAKAPYWAD
jgi:diadenosine tetraphosphate (Ap4A) HIT family hydrolase